MFVFVVVVVVAVAVEVHFEVESVLKELIAFDLKKMTRKTH